MVYEFNDTRFLTKINLLVEEILAGGIRRCKNINIINEEEYIKKTKWVYYLYKRFLICNYESLSNFKLQNNNRISEQGRNFLTFIDMEIQKCDKEYKTLLHIIDEIMYKSIYFDESLEEEDLNRNGIFPIRIIMSKDGEHLFSYGNFMNDRKFVNLNNVNEQCKVVALAVSKSLSKLKDNVPSKSIEKKIE